ncbi:hypothetical protein DYH09_25465 [bacterium CPR1]|nr:hypothetical protein [bacterium CPR1]
MVEDLHACVEHGDFYAPENAHTDRVYQGTITGEAVRAPSFSRTDSFGDSTSTMQVTGRHAKHWTQRAQEFDFTVRDADGRDNLKVNLERDFEGDGRLVIGNEGRLGGHAEIEFPVGKAPGQTLLQPDGAGPWWESKIHTVRLQKDPESCRITLQGEGFQGVYLVKDGKLFQE